MAVDEKTTAGPPAHFLGVEGADEVEIAAVIGRADIGIDPTIGFGEGLAGVDVFEGHGSGAKVMREEGEHSGGEFGEFGFWSFVLFFGGFLIIAAGGIRGGGVVEGRIRETDGGKVSAGATWHGESIEATTRVLGGGGKFGIPFLAVRLRFFGEGSVGIFGLALRV